MHPHPVKDCFCPSITPYWMTILLSLMTFVHLLPFGTNKALRHVSLLIRISESSFFIFRYYTVKKISRIISKINLSHGNKIRPALKSTGPLAETVPNDNTDLLFYKRDHLISGTTSRNLDENMA